METNQDIMLYAQMSIQNSEFLNLSLAHMHLSKHTFIQNDTSKVKSKSACDENYLTLLNKKYFDTQPSWVVA